MAVVAQSPYHQEHQQTMKFIYPARKFAYNASAKKWKTSTRSYFQAYLLGEKQRKSCNYEPRLSLSPEDGDNLKS